MTLTAAVTEFPPEAAFGAVAVVFGTREETPLSPDEEECGVGFACGGFPVLLDPEDASFAKSQ